MRFGDRVVVVGGEHRGRTGLVAAAVTDPEMVAGWRYALPAAEAELIVGRPGCEIVFLEALDVDDAMTLVTGEVAMLVDRAVLIERGNLRPAD